MRRRWLRSAVLCALVTAASASAAPTSTMTQHDPSCFTVALVPTSGAAVLRMPRGFLRAGSDSVWTRAGSWRRDLDYRIDRLHGDLRLLRPLPPGDTLWVRACGLVAPPQIGRAHV